MTKLNAIWLKKMGSHRGSPRLWVECQRIRTAGLEPGVRFDIHPIANDGLKLTIAPEGAFKVSQKIKGDRVVPIIDLNSADVLAPLAQEAVVRIVVHATGIFVLRLASEVAKRERLTRLQAKLQANEPLAVASLAHGGGILANAAHAGMTEAGLDVQLAVVNEIDETYLNQSLEHNDAVTAATIPLCIPMQELVQDSWTMAQLPKVELLEVGIPCSGASSAGRAKRSLAMAESHPHVGHLVYAALALIQKLQPAAVVVENVPNYGNSASAEILRHQLRDMGYNVTEHTLSATDYGCLENRIRWAMVATTDGLSPLDILPEPSCISSATLGDMLEPIALDDSRWSELSYLKDKAERDAEAGKGFKMQVVDETSTMVPVIRKNYNKGGSTDPYVQHPENVNLLRKFTPTEHARIKGVPAHLISDMPATTAHEMLGQGIAYLPFKSLFKALGEKLKSALNHTGVSNSRCTPAIG